MNKCQCPQSGFCEFFRQEMTYSPPNWQWCQNATQKKREEYKITCDKKHDRKMRLRDESFFITCKANAAINRRCDQSTLRSRDDFRLIVAIIAGSMRAS